MDDEEREQKYYEKKRDFKKISKALEEEDEEQYIEVARNIMKKYIPEKAINTFLHRIPTRIISKEEYINDLKSLIHTYRLVQVYRKAVEEDIKAGRVPDPSDIEQIEKGEALGF